MTARDTTKAVAVPMMRISSSVDVKLKPNLRSLMREAPAIVGMPMKKQNSAAVVLSSPRRRAPIIVAPERDVPGMRESTWKRPT